ncbi:hypothetical protein BGX29_007186 [Mortierella sp. GBA35]|nr:hypothetical protein BGX29_007186 [Mortierella sp. GBA35]
MATARSPNDNGADIYNQNAHNLAIYARQREPASTSRFISKIFEPRNVDESGRRNNVLAPAQVHWRTLAQQHDDWVTLQHLWILIRTNPRLQTLNFASGFEIIGRVASEDFISESLGLLKNLESLSATFLDSEDASGTVNENGATVLERVALANPGVLREYTTTILFSRFFEIHSTITSLRYLQLRGALRYREFFLILKHLPNLQSFEIEFFHQAENPSDPEYYDFAKSLLENEPPSRLPNLMFRRFIQVQTVGNNEEMAELVLPWVRHLRGIRTHFMFKSLRHLIKYCPDLERYAERSSPMTIHLRQGPHREVDEISTVLEGFPNLKMLNSIEERLSVNKVLSFPWACSRLEILRIQFVGFDRLTAEEQLVFDSIPKATTSTAEEHGGKEVQQHQSLNEEQQRVLEKHRRCREQHHSFYDRLATLTQLKVLNTGYEYRNVRDVYHFPSSLYRGADGETYFRV